MRAHACTHVLEGARTPANIPRPVYTRVHTCAPRCTHADGEEDEGGREKGTRGEREEQGWDEGSVRVGRRNEGGHIAYHRNAIRSRAYSKAKLT